MKKCPHCGRELRTSDDKKASKVFKGFLRRLEEKGQLVLFAQDPKVKK